MQIEVLNIYENDIEKMLSAVSSARREKAERMKTEVVKRRSLTAAYLLDRMLEKYCPFVSIPANLVEDEHGKPHLYLDDGSEVYFSLSHSGDYAACMISDGPCGIDIETIGDREYEKLLGHVCTEDEKIRIACKEDFYRLWTLKEAAIKADGRGFVVGMNKFCVEPCEDENSHEREFSYRTEIDGTVYHGIKLPSPEGYLVSGMVAE